MTQDTRTVDIGALTQPLHEALGKGLSAFSSVESSLALIFARLINCERFETALVAFDAINLTSPKLRVLRAVAKQHFEREALDPAREFQRLNRLLKRVEARVDLRTKLAHWTVSIWHPENMPITKFDERIEARLLPPWFSAKNLGFNPSESVSLSEIESFTKKCYEVNSELVRYYVAIQETGLPHARG